MKDVIEIGLRYVGIGETGRKQLIEYYNENCFPLVAPERRYRMSLNDDWCAMFVSVVMHKAGIRDNSFPFEVSCFYMLDRFEKAGQVVKGGLSQAVTGDVVFYDWNGDGVPQHVGLFVSQQNGQALILEGNKNNTVGYRTVPLDYDLVCAVCRPLALVEVEAGTEGDYIEQLARGVIRGLYGTGDARKVALGDYYGRVQKRVNELLGFN